MKTLKFIKGPGYLYDLFSLFVLYFNQETFLAEQVNQNKVVEDTEHFNRILSSIDKVPEELRVFFQLKENNMCFFTTFYFFNNTERVFSNLSIDTLQDSIKDYNQVVANVADYYFGSDSVDVSVDSPEFVRTIGKKIRDSEYDLVLKNYLYEFFLDPIPVIQTLSNELTKKELLLSKIYSENDVAITKVQNNLDVDKLIEKTLQMKTKHLDATTLNEIVISICAVHKNCIGLFTSKTAILVLLGTDYEDFSDYMNTKERAPELSQFGIALAEENRIQILELIQERGEVSVADIKKELQFSHTNAYYHVTLLLKSNLLAFRNSGRSVYYRINHAYFKDICTILSRFKQERGGEQ